jgi:protein involved in temperature-dependent protein secretion
MVLDWFGSRNTDVADLIARKKYGKAIEVMRAQFKQRPPSVETRLQFVDVLILAGRGREAVPVLIGLADELGADGQLGKAIGLLKRVEQLEPARPDVEEKLAGLVK